MICACSVDFLVTESKKPLNQKNVLCLSQNYVVLQKKKSHDFIDI